MISCSHVAPLTSLTFLNQVNISIVTSFCPDVLHQGPFTGRSFLSYWPKMTLFVKLVPRYFHWAQKGWRRFYGCVMSFIFVWFTGCWVVVQQQRPWLKYGRMVKLHLILNTDWFQCIFNYILIHDYAFKLPGLLLLWKNYRVVECEDWV